jgi:galactose-1-phosphate uridylyltransferase
MGIKFRMVEELMHFQDPTKDWQPFSRKTEVRYDPLTGQSTRILYYPIGKLNPPDYSDLASKTKAAGCPFCPDLLERLTPKFPPEISSEGRFVKGESTIFPNMFPYGKHSAVGIFSGEHYVKLDQFETKMLADGFANAADYLWAVKRNDTGAKYASINWNYMPIAGASIIHPHLQIIASSEASNYQALACRSAETYFSQNHSNYYYDLIAKEKELNQRYIGQTATITWLSAFAPQGQMDIYAIFADCHGLEQITPTHWEGFSQGLIYIMRYLLQNDFISFNLAVYVTMEESNKDAVHARLIPRTTLGLVGTNDINYFKVLHNEALSLKNPEEAASELKAFFPKGQ